MIAPPNGNMYANSGIRSQVHGSNTLGAPSNNSNSAVKTLDYLSEDSGVGYVNLLYKEMIYDVAVDTPNELELKDGSISETYVAGQSYRVDTSTGREVVKALWSGNAIIDSYYRRGDDFVTGSSNEVRFTLDVGLGWGDDNQFQVASNQESFTDDNGNTGVRGTARFATQYFIDRSE